MWIALRRKLKTIQLRMMRGIEHVLSQTTAGPSLSHCTTMRLRLQSLPKIEIIRAIGNSSFADIHREQHSSAIYRLKQHSLLNSSQKLLLIPEFPNF